MVCFNISSEFIENPKKLNEGSQTKLNAFCTKLYFEVIILQKFLKQLRSNCRNYLK